MSAHNFTIPEILDLSGFFINEGTPEHEEIKNTPEAVWTIPHFKKSYNILCVTQPENNPALLALFDSGGGLDKIHDDALRALDLFIRGAILLSTGDLTGQLKQLHSEIFPEGLSVTQLSFRGEAGEVKYRNSRISDLSKTLLESMSVQPLGTFAEILVRADNAGLELGEIENEKADILKDQKEKFSQQDVLNARRFWIRTLNSFMASVKFIESKSEMMEKIINRIQIAEANADRRANRADKAAQSKQENPETESEEQPARPSDEESDPN